MDGNTGEDIIQGRICHTCHGELPGPETGDLATCGTCRQILAGSLCQICLVPLNPPHRNEPAFCPDCT